ncbi:2-C-methyl-D-erythritol 4-phosphate cytidylyltransferase [Clostridium sp. 'White wine YQ']|uniref:2-C-methyl-D-erythritol 4-phosphate cytidylyltransferase n=1 Tax=Clostridium sp. 'White wine YQ' TaxID=3027474 RepID=UPI0023666882|nr:2-C-methyl-D-erythritol 4-phosphate cytidylyltransferase [Clostridium sp. 'White wine YQ']MDD7796410.1 2-C-methyl-D-erythritol 4-phosphate cytidylyltransferase [Clostridium sp. 'White wine YQ']
MNKVVAVIVAGGKGKRMSADISKQFIELKGRPILYYTLDKFLKNENIDKVVLVLPEDEIEYCKENILDKYNLNVWKLVPGGKERSDSVYNGLKSIEGNTEVVLIHDGARPFVSNEIIENGIKYAKLYGAAACGVTPKDTIKVIGENGFSKETPNRNTLFAVQTPQSFKYNLILKAHESVREKGTVVTDDTMVAELYGEKVFLYHGDYNNIKITTPEDLIIAENLI